MDSSNTKEKLCYTVTAMDRNELLSPEQKRLIAKHQIYILGPENIQNQLMRDLFRYELQCYPGLSPDIHAFPVSSNLHGGHRLLLIDAGCRDMDYFLESYEFVERIMPYFKIVGFFNLKETWGKERRAIDAGVKGFFYETDSVSVLCEGIYTLFIEGLWIPKGGLFEPAVPDADQGEGKVERREAETVAKLLTRRELQILRLLQNGYTNEAIGEQLKIGISTVKTHLYNTYKKIGVSNRAEAIVWTVRYLKVKV